MRLTMREVQTSRAEAPFLWAYQGRDNLPLKRRYAEIFAGSFPLAPLAPRRPSNGVRHVGLVVTATHEGVFLRCMGGLIDRLDRRRWRVTVACPRGAVDRMRRNLANRDVQLLALPQRFDHATAELRAAAFDLIYFWEVGTDATNYFLPFNRLAPVQCTGWGWPVDERRLGSSTITSRARRSRPRAPSASSPASASCALPHLPAYCVRSPALPRPEPPGTLRPPRRRPRVFAWQNLRKVHPEHGRVLRCRFLLRRSAGGGGIRRRDVGAARGAAPGALAEQPRRRRRSADDPPAPRARRLHAPARLGARDARHAPLRRIETPRTTRSRRARSS